MPTTITRVNFGFPINVTEEINFSEIEEFKKKDFTNKNLHLKITIEDKLGKNFNSETFKEEVKNATHCNNIKIDYYYNNESSERSKEVAEAQTLVDKFKKYAELNEIKYSDTVIAKLEDIQDHLLINNSVPSDAFELEYMSLRGNVGIWDGQQKDDIEFDFSKFNDGIVCLQGANGSGKTVSLEMMNPYNSHLTRMGSLKDYFRLKDSHKILIYKNSAGRRYKISMFIDGKATSVMTTYKIDIMEPGSDKWIDGPEVKSADDYKKWVEAVFGPKDMFLRTAFFTTKQIKNLPDLSVATKTEKMILFSNLAGIDYLSMIQDAAKDRIKIEEDAIEDIKGQIKNYDNIEERLSEIDKEIENNNSDLEKYKELINIDNEELALCNEEQKKYLTAAGAFDIVKRTLTEKEIKIDDNVRETGRIEIKIASYNEDLDDLDLYKEQLAWWNENTPKLKTLNSEKDKIDAERNEAAKKYNTALTENRNVEKNIDSIKNAIYKYDLEIKSLTKSIPETDGNCPVCGAPLSEHKKEELENEVKSIKEQISKLEETKVNAEKEIDDLQTTIKDVSSLEDEYNKLNSKYMEIANDITDIQTYSERIDIDKVKDVINNYAVKVEELNNTKDAILKENEQLAKDVEELRTQLNTMPTDYTDKINRLTRGIQDSQQNIATLTAENASLAREKKTLTSNEALVKKIKAEIKEREQTIKEYMILQLAFSNNGIQALELASAAPEISEIANSILYSSYGERFTIKFETKRNTKDNKKTIDDFIIRVFDSRSGSRKVLEDLSQSESLWIKQALYYAFSVIRARRTGFCFKTRFLDESDGPLDTAATRLTYLKMIEMAHKMSNASKTILITHSADIKEMIEQSISM